MLEVLFTPADFGALPGRDLSQSTCVVLDVLRATSSMLTALANGASAILPAADLAEALAARARQPDVLLAGERDGVRILGHLTGGVDFDFGNSPREFAAQRVAGHTIVWTTTNGTRALRACAGARSVLVGALLNLGALTRHLRLLPTRDLLVICSGTYEQTAYEDVLAAGALCELLSDSGQGQADSAQIARQTYKQAAGATAGTGGRGPAGQAALLAEVRQHSRNARRLLSRPELADDVPFCLQRDTLDVVACLMPDGWIRPLACA